MGKPTDSDYCLSSPASIEHALLLEQSFSRLFGQSLAGDLLLEPKALAAALYHAPFVLLSHQGEKDPVFNYANLAAQALFELPWKQFVGLASRYSAEPDNRQARQQLLEQVATDGYIKHYQGIRISRSGKRFSIENATVWNLVDKGGVYCGQAAMFKDWHYITEN